MRYISLITLLAAAGTAHGALIYELTPDLYTVRPGGTIQTFANVTNTGSEGLYYAYSFVDPGTLPVSGVTGQLPPTVLQPGESVYFAAATLTTHPGTAAAAYTFNEGVGYRLLGVSDIVEASDVGMVVVVPEPASFFLCGLSLISMMLACAARL